MSVVQWVLMGLGVLAVAVSCLGVLVTPGTAEKLHYTTPASLVAPGLLTVAAFLDDGLSLGPFKFLLAAALLGLAGPVITHATARAARVRERGRWDLRPEESDPAPPA